MDGGANIEGWQLLRELDREPCSSLHLAKVPGFDGERAVRILGAASIAPSSFIADASVLAGHVIPRAVNLRLVGRNDKGDVFAVVDRIDGADRLTENLEESLEVRVAVVALLCEAVGTAHNLGVMIGPIAPRDVLLTPDGPLLDLSSCMARRSSGWSVERDVEALKALLKNGVNDLQSLAIALEEVKTVAQLKTALEAAQAAGADQTRPSGQSHKSLPPVPLLLLDECDLSGQVFGPWQLIKLLGEGSMGRVYLGHHTRIGRDVAVKVLRAEHAKNREVVSRFLQEATAVNAIKNDHIVEVYDYGEDTTWPDMPRAFCVMELLDGRSLAAELANGPLPVQRACRIAQQVARALDAAHTHGVVHRDVKPENLFLSNLHGESDYVKVLDFGVAKLCKPLAGMPISGTIAGAIIGTPDYMAPEQAQGLEHDRRVDIYSLGLVLYEALTGRRPFQAETFGQLVVQICTMPLPPMGDKTPSGEPIPKALQQVVARCLEKEASRRWQSAEELAAALEPWVSARPQRKRTLQRARWVLTAALAGVIASVGLSVTTGSAVASVAEAAPAKAVAQPAKEALTASARPVHKVPDALEAPPAREPSPTPASAVLTAAREPKPAVNAARKAVGSKPAVKAVKAAKKGFSRDRIVDPFAD